MLIFFEQNSLSVFQHINLPNSVCSIFNMLWRDLIPCIRLYEITITYATFLISSISHVISASSCRSICMLACNYKNILEILNVFYTWDYKRWNLYCLPSLSKYEFFCYFHFPPFSLHKYKCWMIMYVRHEWKQDLCLTTGIK